MNRLLTSVFTLCLPLMAMAQSIDFNMTGRSDEEVNEPDYTPWAVSMGASEKKTLDGGVTLTVAAAGGADILRAQWHKNTCTAGKNGTTGLRLLGDGVMAFQADDDNNTPNLTNVSTAITLTIEGLTPGRHSVIAYHNHKDTKTGDMPTVRVDVNGTTAITGGKFTNVMSTATDLKMSEAGSTYVEFDVAEGQPVVITYSTEVAAGKEYQTTCMMINGLLFDTNPYMAQDPVPDNMEYHADADNGSLTLSWAASSVAVSHKLVLGTDADAVETATTYDYEGTANSYTASQLSPLLRYYWRVDEVDAAGTVHKGRVWSFQPRRIAFPGAEGYGRFALGGRGGTVFHVTTLDDNGDDDNPIEGSLRYGLKKATGPRTIVFDVAGVISLKSRLTCSDKFVTIAGQTAPAQGILLRTCPLGMQSDGITRFLRMRLGHKRLGSSGVIPKESEDIDTQYGEDRGKYDETTLGGLDGLGMAGCDNAIMDHCSISWTIDEGFSSRNAKGITLQRTLISEALNQAGHPNYGKGTQHGYAATIGAGQMSQTPGSFHHNLLAHNEGRNWSISGGLDGKGFYDGAHDVFNNVVYNWGGRACDGGTHELNFVANYYKKGPATTQNYLLRHQFEGTGSGTQRAYVSGNVREEISGTKTQDSEGNTYRYDVSSGQTLDWQPWSAEPFFPSYATIETAEAAYKNVLSDVGCTQPFFDLHDQRMVSETMSRTTTTKGSRSGKKGLIDSEEDEGCEGFDLAKLGMSAAQRDNNWDTDQDGIPDWFETTVGTNPSAANNNDDRDGDYFTDLEEYLNWIAVPNYRLQAGEKVTIDLKPFFAGYKEPVFETSPEMDNGTSWTVDEQGLLTFQDGIGNRLTSMTVTATEDGISMTRAFHFACTGESAGIVNLKADGMTTANAPIYNLNGLRVQQPAQKGLYIQGGRKFVVR